MFVSPNNASGIGSFEFPSSPLLVFIAMPVAFQNFSDCLKCKQIMAQSMSSLPYVVGTGDTAQPPGAATRFPSPENALFQDASMMDYQGLLEPVLNLDWGAYSGVDFEEFGIGGSSGGGGVGGEGWGVSEPR